MRTISSFRRSCGFATDRSETGFEAGMGIVALAIVLDRLTQAAAHNKSVGRGGYWKRRDTLLALGLLAVPTLATQVRHLRAGFRLQGTLLQ